MARSKKKPHTSWFKRFLYLIMVVSGGSSGWLAKDYPQVQAVLGLLTGNTPIGESPVGESAVESVVELLKPVDDFSQPGTFTVTIPKVHLDPKLFRLGKTVDIQARVVKLDSNGNSSTLWETKSYGERLAVAGRDDLVAGWPQRPFQVEWNPGDKLSVEVYDRRTLPFLDPTKLVLEPADSQASQFPLKPGTFSLQAAQQSDTPLNPRNNTIVLQSERVGDLQGRRVAEPQRARPTLTRSAGPTSQDDDSTVVIK
jgi:hypothetical protein